MGGGGTRRVVAGWVLVLGLALIWFALVAPGRPDRITPLAFLRLPVEAVAWAGLALLLPRGIGRVVTVVVGVLLGLLVVVKLVDLGFWAVLDRPFRPLTDGGNLAAALDFVTQSSGPVAAIAAVVGGGLTALALVAGMPILLGRVGRVVTRHRRRSVWAVTAAGVAWTVSAVLGLAAVPYAPIASADAGRLAVEQARSIAADVGQARAIDAAAATDRFRSPSGGTLSGLRGKDVLVAFVESYGRVAVEGPASRGVQATLDAGTRRLQASGYAARSGYLTSPTFGGASWLAHATLQSGVWVDNGSSYTRLLSGTRATLTRLFGGAGWRTVAVLPADREPWPQGSAFYRFDAIYDSAGLGYAGPGFGWSTMPDQYVLRRFQQLELARRDRPPVMAEIDLTSSHAPWAPLPTMLDWERLGNGSVYEAVHGRAQSADALWKRPGEVRGAYLRSVEYSLTALISFVERYGDDDLVLVLLGDHQPATVVTGPGATRDVPVTVVSRDRSVLDRISGWGWHQGLRPGPGAPVWPMSAFRDRFLDAFGAAGPVAAPATAPGATR